VHLPGEQQIKFRLIKFANITGSNVGLMSNSNTSVSQPFLHTLGQSCKYLVVPLHLAPTCKPFDNYSLTHLNYLPFFVEELTLVVSPKNKPR